MYLYYIVHNSIIKVFVCNIPICNNNIIKDTNSLYGPLWYISNPAGKAQKSRVPRSMLA